MPPRLYDLMLRLSQSVDLETSVVAPVSNTRLDVVGPSLTSPLVPPKRNPRPRHSTGPLVYVAAKQLRQLRNIHSNAPRRVPGLKFFYQTFGAFGLITVCLCGRIFRLVASTIDTLQLYLTIRA